MSQEEEVDITTEEAENVIKALKALKLKPKADTPQDFQKWLKIAASAQQIQVKAEGGATANQHPGFPRLSTFNGSPKGETTYELWRFEIQCLVREKVYRHDQILQAMRRSAKGEAANIMMRLGTSASIDDIIQKMNSIYDTIDSGQRILGQFYSEEQEASESVSDWGCRLEQLLNRAVNRGEVMQHQVEDMLRHAFWEGLRSDLKDVSGYIYDKHMSFDELRSELRAIEQDHDRRKRGQKGKKDDNGHVMSAAHEEEPQSGIAELRGMIQNLTAEVQQLKDGREARAQQPHSRGNRGYSSGYNRGGGAYRGSWQQQQQQHGYQGQPLQQLPQYGFQGQQPHQLDFQGQQPQQFDFQGQGQYRGHRGGYQPRQGRGRSALGPNGLPICYNCGQEGHVQLGCRVRTDHLNKPLNYRGPASRGRR